MITIKPEILILFLTLSIGVVRILEGLIKQLVKKPEVKQPTLTPEQNMMLESLFCTQKDTTKVLSEIAMSIEKVSILIEAMFRK